MALTLTAKGTKSPPNAKSTISAMVSPAFNPSSCFSETCAAPVVVTHTSPEDLLTDQLPPSAAAWKQQRPDVLKKVLQSLGDLPPRPAKPAVTVVTREERDGYRLEKLRIDNGAGTLESIKGGLTSVSGLPGGRSLSDTTAFGDAGNRFIPSLENTTFSVAGMFDSAA